MDSEDFPASEPDRSSETVVRVSIEKWIKAISAQPPKVVITFNRELDSLLSGGFHPGYITEVFGGKGVGKTTLCMQICITAQLPRKIQGMEWEAIFIDTERTFTENRISEMIQGCVEHCSYFKALTCKVTAADLLNGITVLPCDTLEELRTTILELDFYLLQRPKVRVLVIDSIAFLYSTDPVFSNSSSAGAVRNKSVYYFAQELNRLINKYGLVVLVTNNVTTKFDGQDKQMQTSYLGPSWVHLPQVRLELNNSGSIRRAVLRKHFRPIPQKNSADFKIRTAGIRNATGLLLRLGCPLNATIAKKTES